MRPVSRGRGRDRSGGERGGCRGGSEQQHRRAPQQHGACHVAPAACRSEPLSTTQRGEGAWVGWHLGCWWVNSCPACPWVRWVMQCLQGLVPSCWQVDPARSAGARLSSSSCRSRDCGPGSASKVVESLRKELASQNPRYNVR